MSLAKLQQSGKSFEMSKAGLLAKTPTNNFDSKFGNQRGTFLQFLVSSDEQDYLVHLSGNQEH